MEDIWENQLCGKKFSDNVKQLIRKKYVNAWKIEIFESPKCTNYRVFKRDLKFESYLIKLPFKLRLSFTKFRVSNHRLPIEYGRHINVDRQLRKCFVCEILSDEFHALFECVLFHEERNKYLNNGRNGRVNAIQYFNLFNTKSIIQLKKLAQFVKIIMEYYKSCNPIVSNNDEIMLEMERGEN